MLRNQLGGCPRQIRHEVIVARRYCSRLLAGALPRPACAALLMLLLCQEVDGSGVVSGTGWGARSSCQMRLARWRLSDRIASRWVLPSVFLRATKSIVSG